MNDPIIEERQEAIFYGAERAGANQERRRNAARWADLTTEQLGMYVLAEKGWLGVEALKELEERWARKDEASVGRCRRCGQTWALLGGICGSCADDLRGERDAEEAGA